ncbi:MAG: EamA family transporter [Saprospiraceae bacterium]|nr:EamA family transporter [Saprospiraceae bacterium]
MEKSIDQSPTLKHWILLLALAIVWGFSFLFIKRGLVAYTPLEVSSIRMGVAFISFLPFAIAKLKFITFKNLWKFIFVGYFSSGIPSVLFPIAQQHISSSVAGILNSLTPLFTLLIGIFYYKNTVGIHKIIGVLIGFFGAIILIYFNSKSSFSGNIFFAFLIILATICYGMNVNFLQNKMRSFDSLTISAWSYMMTGIPAIFYLIFGDFSNKLVNHPSGWNSFMYIAILSVLGTCIASYAFNRLLQATSGLWASTVTYLMPIFSTIIGLYDGEIIAWYHIVGMLLILSGVYLTSKRKVVL